MASNKREQSRAYKLGNMALNSGLLVAGAGGAARKIGTELQRSGNRALSSPPRGTSTFGPGASPEAQRVSRRAQRAVAVGHRVRRSAKHLPYVGGALAVGGGAAMANDYISRRRASVQKNERRERTHSRGGNIAAGAIAGGLLAGAARNARVYGQIKPLFGKGPAIAGTAAQAVLKPVTVKGIVLGGGGALAADTVMRKSYIPGEGYRRAVDVGVRGLRRAAKHRRDGTLPRRAAAARRKETARTKSIEEGQRQLNTSASVTPSVQEGATTTYPVKNLTQKSQGLSGAAWFNGKKRNYAYDSSLEGKAAESLHRHEKAHLSPKRRHEGRLRSILSSDKKIGAEEARADMSSRIYWREAQKSPIRGSYADSAATPGGGGLGINRDFRRSYRKTQDKIWEAQNPGQKKPFPKVRASRYASDLAAPLAVGGAVAMSPGSVKKKDWSDNHLAARKKVQGVLSGSSGVAGIAGLGALIVGRGKSPAAAAARKLTVPLTTTSAGVGGVSSLNLASVMRQEANKAKKDAAKSKAQAAKINRLDRQVRSITKSVVPSPTTAPAMRKPTPVAGKTLNEKNRVAHQKAVLNNVFKASTSLSPEMKRLRRLDRYETGLGASGVGAMAAGAGLGAAKYAPKAKSASAAIRASRRDPEMTVRARASHAAGWARNTKPNSYSDGSPKVKRVGGREASVVRRVTAAARNNPLRVAGAGAALAAGSYGVNRYKNNGGKSYRPLPRPARD